MSGKSGGKANKIIGRILLVLSVVVIILIAVFHNWVFGFIRIEYGKFQLKKRDSGLTYTERHMTKEQMLTDFDYLYQNACTDTLIREEAEKYLKLDYDEVYSTYRKRIEGCADEYEFLSVMMSFMARMPGVHNVMCPPWDDLNNATTFPLFWELGRKDIRQSNYDYWKQFEDRMWSYDQKSLIAANYADDYIILPYSFGNETIEGLDYGRIITLNGEPIQNVLNELDVIHHFRYDEHNDRIRVAQLFFNDSLGKKYEAEIELPDGSIVRRDLYVSAEYNTAMQYRKDLYPQHESDPDMSAETGSSADSTQPKKSYKIETDEKRKLVYAYIPECLSSEKQVFFDDMTAALESVDAENIILDFKANGGGDFSFVTDGVGRAVFDGEAGWINISLFPKTDITKLHLENKASLVDEVAEDAGDCVRLSEDMTVRGEAKKKYNIYLLIARNTFSSGDIFAQIAAAEDNVTILGENTSGEGLTGNPLAYYLPESKFPIVISTALSERCPDDNYVGVVPDIYCPMKWEDMIKRKELSDDPQIKDHVSSYEYRQQWDPTVIEALKLIDGTSSAA